jgi:hypothetical protein
MQRRSFQFTTFIAIAIASVTGCGAGDISDSDMGDDAMQTVDDSSDENMSLGTLEQGLMSCLNLDGTNSAMAALAVAVAQDLGRWQAGKDFVVGYSNGEILALASGSDASGPIGKSRCADGKCARVQAILDMQLDVTANKVYFQGSGSTKVLVNPSALRSRMVSKWREQRDYDGRAQDGVYYQAPKEEHKLAFVSAAKGGCDTNFTFKATKTTGATLLYPNQLKWKLAFADINNPYLGFTNLGGGNVSIDPTYGLNTDSSTSSGSCTAACTKISLTSVAGQCCSCGGVTKTFVKSAWSATTFLCQ